MAKEKNIYRVKKDDVLSKIARQFNTTVGRLQELNPEIKDADRIREGQTIRLRASDDSGQHGGQQERHLIRRGHTFSGIAAKYGLTQAQLKALNPQIQDIDDIKAGAFLNIATARPDAKPQPADKPARLENQQKSPERLSSGARQTPSYGSHKIDSDLIQKAWEIVEGKAVAADFQQASRDTRPLIVIDPGHFARNRAGEMDPGAVSADGLREIDVGDPVALKLAGILEKQGYRVAFSRTPGEEYRYSSDKDGPGRLGSRAQFAHALEDLTGAPYTLFISLHSNAYKDTTVHGMEIVVDAHKNPQSMALAKSVEGHLAGHGGLRDRGVHPYRNIEVLGTMETGDPAPGQEKDAAILIEFGFLSSDKDTGVLHDISKNPQPVAEKIARGVTGYIESRQTTLENTISSTPGPEGPA